MGIFVDGRGRPVTVGENTIYLRTEFTVRQGLALRRLQEAVSVGDPEAGERLLSIIIAGWEGPAFEGVPCTAENIARLNMADPLVQEAIRAYQEILTGMADPKSTAPATAHGGQHSRGARVR